MRVDDILDVYQIDGRDVVTYTTADGVLKIGVIHFGFAEAGKEALLVRPIEVVEYRA